MRYFFFLFLGTLFLPNAHGTDLFLSTLEHVAQGSPFSFGEREGIYVGHCFDPVSYDRVSSSALVIMHTSEPVLIEGGIDVLGRGNALLRLSPSVVANAISHLRQYYTIDRMNPLSATLHHSKRDPRQKSEMVFRVYGNAIVVKFVYRGPERVLFNLRGGLRLPVEPGDTWYACLYAKKITPEITLP